jgi:LEA14-like dessication related protein
MKIHRFLAMSLYTIVLFLLSSCAGLEVTQGPIKAPEVKMISCLPSFAGSESISLTPIFTISNPNPFFLEVMMDYNLEIADKFLGKSGFSSLYIPPNKTIEAKDTMVIPFKKWIGSEIFAGKNPKEAMMIVGPLWKGLGGEQPSNFPEEAWKKIPEKNPVMRAKGSIIVATEKGRDIFNFVSEKQE